MNKLFKPSFKNTIGKLLSIIIVLTLILSSCSEKNTSSAEDLSTIIEKHFNSMQNRDIETLLSTVSEPNLTLIQSNGSFTKTTTEYTKENKNWFNSKDWRFDYKIIDTTFINSIAVVYTKMTYFYIDDSSTEASFEYFLTLIFEETSGGWKLRYDQNSPAIK